MITAPQPFPSPLTAGDYLLGATGTAPGFAVQGDGSLSVSSGASGQAAALLPAARLPDGGTFSARFTPSAVSGVRFGLLITNGAALPPSTGLWFTLEDQGGNAAQRVRLLRYTAGNFAFNAPTTAVTGGPTLTAGQPYVLALRRTGQLYTLSIDGADVLTYLDGNDTFNEEPIVGVQVAFFSSSQSYTVVPLPVGMQTAGTLTSETYPGTETRLIRAGRPGYDLGPVGAGALPISGLSRALVPVQLDGSRVRVAGTGVALPAGAGGAVTARNLPLLRADLGYAEPATDAAMPAWDAVTPGGGNGVAVTPASRRLRMVSKPNNGYAYRTKGAMDHTKDVTLEYWATLEQVAGSRAWLGGVLWVYEHAADGSANYIGVNVNCGQGGNTGGQVVTAMYGDEAFTNRQPVITPLGEEHHHRLIWDAQGQRVLWIMDGVWRSAMPWTATGPIRAWLGCVAGDGTGSGSDQCAATFRDVRILGTPIPNTA